MKKISLFMMFVLTINQAQTHLNIEFYSESNFTPFTYRYITIPKIEVWFSSVTTSRINSPLTAIHHNFYKEVYNYAIKLYKKEPICIETTSFYKSVALIRIHHLLINENRNYISNLFNRNIFNEV